MSAQRSTLLRTLVLFIGLIALFGQPGGYARADDPEPISRLNDVHKAVVRIMSVGTFREPGGMTSSRAGSGSGFIIDPAGIAVTNNHVVTGAAILKVYVAGEDEPRSARVLGVSECSDLAVIDIAGEGYPYLDWYKGDIQVGMDVYTAGFPFGVSEFTMTRGIVSQAKADGETNWASVGEVLMHDATINPGNSGGPLINAEAKVIGVNYMGNDANQYFAIARNEALPIIERLRSGADDLSLGINGDAFISEDGNLQGIWVNSVKSGSPADGVGIEPGDIIYSIEGLPLAAQGTMSEYCDILRSHAPDEVMNVEVARFDTGEFMAGQLNNTQGQLKVTGNLSISEPRLEYTPIFDDNNLLQVEIPTTWVEIDGALPANEERFVVMLTASPDLNTFYNDWTVPGIIFGASIQSDLTVKGLLDQLDYSNACTYQGREDYDDGLYTGQADVWTECGGEGGATLWVLSVKPEDESYTALVLVQSIGQDDLEAAGHILDTFIVSEEIINSVPGPVAPLAEDTIEYTAVTDDNHLLQVEVPATWVDISGAVPEGEERFAAVLSASPDLEAFFDTWTAPGLTFAVSTQGDLTVEGLLDQFGYSSACTYQGREDYDDGLYTGQADVWTECGGEGGATLWVLSVKPEDESFTALVQVQMVGQDAVKVLEHIFQTFIVSPLPAENAGSDTPGKPRFIGQAKDIIQYTAVTDDNHLLQVEIPTTWVDVSGVVPEGEERFQAVLTASPDMEAFVEGWTVPGLILAVSTRSDLTVEGLLDQVDYSNACTYQGREEYLDALHAGLADIWTECGNEMGAIMVVSARPVDESYTVLLLVQATSEDDLKALEHILQTFAVSSSSLSSLQEEEATRPERPTPTPIPEPGLGTLGLWGGSIQGTLAPGGERWYVFNSNDATDATLIAFLRNAGQVDMIIYNGQDIPVWPHHDPNNLPNLGVGSEQGNRDQDDQTRELVWQGPVVKQQKYYVRFINRGNTQLQYCIAPRPDKYTCPY